MCFGFRFWWSTSFFPSSVRCEGPCVQSSLRSGVYCEGLKHRLFSDVVMERSLCAVRRSECRLHGLLADCFLAFHRQDDAAGIWQLDQKAAFLQIWSFTDFFLSPPPLPSLYLEVKNTWTPNRRLRLSIGVFFLFFFQVVFFWQLVSWPTCSISGEFVFVLIWNNYYHPRAITPLPSPPTPHQHKTHSTPPPPLPLTYTTLTLLCYFRNYLPYL